MVRRGDKEADIVCQLLFDWYLHGNTDVCCRLVFSQIPALLFGYVSREDIDCHTLLWAVYNKETPHQEAHKQLSKHSYEELLEKSPYRMGELRSGGVIQEALDQQQSGSEFEWKVEESVSCEIVSCCMEAYLSSFKSSALASKAVFVDFAHYCFSVGFPGSKFEGSRQVDLKNSCWQSIVHGVARCMKIESLTQRSVEALRALEKRAKATQDSYLKILASSLLMAYPEDKRERKDSKEKEEKADEQQLSNM